MGAATATGGASGGELAGEETLGEAEGGDHAWRGLRGMGK